MKRVTILILILAISTLAGARDKKTKVKPGPYVFTSKASAQTIKALLVQESLRDGYALDSDSDHELQFRFSRPAQMPLYGQIFMASSTSVCPGMTTKQVWSYTLAESNGVTKVTVQPAWDYPDDYCKVQTNAVPWSKPEEMVAFQAMLDKAPATVAQPPAAKSAAVAATVAAAAAPTATAVGYRQQDNVGAGPASHPVIQPATQAATQAAAQPQVVAQDDAARRAQQHQACLDLAKDNPSITCK